MISTAHPLMIVNRAADIHYVLLMFPSMVEHRSGVDSPQRENGCEHLVLMFLFVAREITCCPPRRAWQWATAEFALPFGVSTVQIGD